MNPSAPPESEPNRARAEMRDKKTMAINASESGRRTIPRRRDLFAGGAKSGSSKSSLITPRSE